MHRVSSFFSLFLLSLMKIPTFFLLIACSALVFASPLPQNIEAEDDNAGDESRNTLNLSDDWKQGTKDAWNNSGLPGSAAFLTGKTLKAIGDGGAIVVGTGAQGVDWAKRTFGDTPDWFERKGAGLKKTVHESNQRIKDGWHDLGDLAKDTKESIKDEAKKDWGKVADGGYFQ